MRNKTEQYWKEKEGKIFHIKIEDIIPYMEGLLEINCTLLEDDERFSFEVDTETDE